MNRRTESGLTLPELLVVLCLIAILWSLALPSVTDELVKGEKTQSLSNMKQLHLATQQMALDSSTTGDTNIGWPGDLDGSFERWATNLVSGNYLSTNDLCKLLSLKGRITAPGRIPGANTNAVLVYAVSGTSPGDAVFLSTANFTNTPTGGLPPLKKSLPYGDTGYVIFHKAGDGAILAQRQVGAAYTNIIGSYVPLCTSYPGLVFTPPTSGPTWQELVVKIGGLILVGLLAFPLYKLMRRPPAAPPILRARQILRCMKQLHLATMGMALDRSTTGHENIGWPGDMEGSFSTWASKLDAESYLSPPDLRQMLAGNYTSKPRRKWLRKEDVSIPQENTHAILVYAVSEDSPPNSIFLSTANYTITPDGDIVDPSSPLMDGKFFVVMTREGRGMIVPLQEPETGEPLPPEYIPAEQWASLERSYAPLCR